MCVGGDAPPYPHDQYWGDITCEEYGGNTSCAEPYLFIECNPPEFCAEQFRCEAGHTGRLCLVPAHGWFVLGKRYYLRCGADGQATSSFLILAVFFIWFLMNKVASGNYDALDIGLLFVQITGTPSYLQPPFFPRWGVPSELSLCLCSRAAIRVLFGGF